MPPAIDLPCLTAGAPTRQAAPLLAEEFAALMAPLGPFLPGRAVAVAVSGGADSLALAVLAAEWGQVTALIVDHGLRAEAAQEAVQTAGALHALGIPAQILKLALARGPGMAARARAARYAALEQACQALGLVHLLVGHHLRDQAETLLLRAGHGSGPAGLAAMPAWQAGGMICLLRPLLGVPPGRLRATLCARGLSWVEDPSNHDPRAERTRLRATLAGPPGGLARSAALAAQARAWGQARADADATLARESVGVAIHPEGYAKLPDGPIAPALLAALIQVIGGAAYPPPAAAVQKLAAMPRPATLAGTRLMAVRGQWWLLREVAAMAPPLPVPFLPVLPAVVWDGRFALHGRLAPGDWTIGALGSDAAKLRHASLRDASLHDAGPARGSRALPAALRQTLPALRLGGQVAAVPQLGYWSSGCDRMAIRCVFAPPRPLAGACFSPIAW